MFKCSKKCVDWGSCFLEMLKIKVDIFVLDLYNFFDDVEVKFIFFKCFCYFCWWVCIKLDSNIFDYVFC